MSIHLDQIHSDLVGNDEGTDGVAQEEIWSMFWSYLVRRIVLRSPAHQIE